MNKTLLLIICDFLLLNLLALTRWDKLEPVPSQKAPVPQLKANVAAPQNQDVADVMKLALENERATRSQLEQRLQFAESDVKTREQTLAQLQGQKAELETTLGQVRQKEQDLSQRYSAATREASQSQEKAQQLQQALASAQSDYQRQQQELQRQQQNLAALEQQKAAIAQQAKVSQAEKDLLREQMEKQLQQALAEKQAELERQRQALAAADQARNAAMQQAASAETARRVAETQRDLFGKRADDLKNEVAVVRQEKDKIQAQATELSGGVTKLAAKTGELTQEIRENTPINMNLMFSQFLSNRVDVNISARGAGILGPGVRQKETKTVLVRDGNRVFALLHVTETPFTITTPASGMSGVSARVSIPGKMSVQGPVQFWAIDPRIIMVPVDAQQAASVGVKIYSAARNPFKFTEAVLINRGGKYYGEVEFKLDPRTPDYVRMKNRLVSRIVNGEFSPSAGDLVLSKTGEFLGIMANADYCAVAKSLDARPEDVFTENTLPEQMRPKLEEFRKKIDALPFALR